MYSYESSESEDALAPFHCIIDLRNLSLVTVAAHTRTGWSESPPILLVLIKPLTEPRKGTKEKKSKRFSVYSVTAPRHFMRERRCVDLCADVYSCSGN